MLVVLEGIDGSGKKTQTTLLQGRLEESGFSAASFSFPRYTNNEFGRAVANYLNGEFGDVGQVPPQFAALLYAGDRFAARGELVEATRNADVVICDRYVPSNLAHQGAKLPPEKRSSFMAWIEAIEYGIYGLPRADLTILLDVPADLANKMVLRKGQRDYTAHKADIHERDKDYLTVCRDVFLHLAKDGASSWVKIACTSNGRQLRSSGEISDAVWEAVSSRLVKK